MGGDAEGEYGMYGIDLPLPRGIPPPLLRCTPSEYSLPRSGIIGLIWTDHGGGGWYGATEP